MAIQYIGNTISGVSGDTKPTLSTYEKGVIFIETDTNKVYQWDTDSWNEIVLSDASTSAKGIASFHSDNFAASSGAITIKNGGVILGTETTGNYVATVAGTSNEVDVSASTGTVTIGLPNDVTIGQDLVVTRNLTVSGTTVTANVNNLTIEDPLLYLANGQSSSPAFDSGFVVERGNTTNVAFIWDESNDEFVTANVPATQVGETAGDVGLDSYAQLKTGKTIVRVHDTDNDVYPTIMMEKSANATVDNYSTVIADNERLGLLMFRGSNGSSMQTGAYIGARAAEAWDGNGLGTDIYFVNKTNDSTSEVEVMTLDQSGDVGIGVVPTHKLTVAGDINMTAGFNIRSTGGDLSLRAASAGSDVFAYNNAGVRFRTDGATTQFTGGVGIGGVLDLSGDNVAHKIGATGDTVLYHRTTALAADATLSGVVLGSPKTLYSRADTLFISNVTEDAGIHMLANLNGNSYTVFLADAAGGSTWVNAHVNQAVRLTVNATDEYVFSNTTFDALSNNITTTGSITGASLKTTRSGSGGEVQILIENTNADGAGDVLKFYKNSASPAANDSLGYIEFHGEDSAGNDENYSYMIASSPTVTSGAEDGTLSFHNKSSGSYVNPLKLVENNAIFGGNVGIGSSPDVKLDVTLGSIGGTDTEVIRLGAAGADVGTESRLMFQNGAYPLAYIASGYEAATSNGFLSFATYDSGWTEAMRIDKDSTVGIGTTSPTAARLSVRHSLNLDYDSITSNLAVAAGTNHVADFYNNDAQSNTNQRFALINLLAHYGSYAAGQVILGIVSMADRRGDFIIGTRNGTTATVTEKMRLTWDGKLGIGTTSPANLLQVGADTGGGGTISSFATAVAIYGTSSGNAGALYVNDTTGTGTTAGVGGKIVFGGRKTSSAYEIFSSIQGFKENATSNNYAGGLYFRTTANAGNEAIAMTITSAGNVGIGGTPSVILHSAESQSGITSWRLENTHTSSGNIAFQFKTADTGVTSAYRQWDIYMSNNDNTGDLRFYNNSTDLFTITPAGNVGIGAAPNVWNRLVVTGAIGSGYGSAYIDIPAGASVNATNGEQQHIMQIKGTIVKGSSGSHPVLSTLKLMAPTVGAGDGAVTKTAVLYIPDVMSAGPSGSNYAIYVSAGESYFGGNINGNGDILLSDGNPIYWGVSNTANIRGIDGNGSYLAFGTAGTEKMRIDSNGNVGIGTSPHASGNLHIKGSSTVGHTAIYVDSTTVSSVKKNADITFKHEGTMQWNIGVPGLTEYFRITDADGAEGMYMQQGDTAWRAISDERKKTNWVPFTNVLDKLATITKLGTFQKKNPTTGELKSEKRYVGVSAQEIKEILPEAIGEIIDPNDGETYLSLKYQDVFVLMLKAIQELKTEIDILKAS